MMDSAKRPDRRCVVTGATSGLGRAMAILLGRRGGRVAITGRRAPMLDAAAAEVRQAGAADVLVLHGGVDDPAVVAGHHATIVERWGGLDLAILNAGVGGSNDPRAFSAEAYRDAFAVNFFGVVYWLECLVPGMAAGGGGVIAGISSPGGWRGFPGIGPYSASKSALSTMLESVRIGLRGTGVCIVDVCPGYVKSEMTAKNDPKHMPFLMETEVGAARILRGIDRRQRLVHFPRRLTWPLRHVVARLPGAVFDPLAARFGRPGAGE